MPWGRLTCERGHLEVLKWARKNRTRLLEGGGPQVLKWARENDCVGRVRARRRAATSRC